MTLERARVERCRKPWGAEGVLPWTAAQGLIGELLFEGSGDAAEYPQLQIKLKFAD